MYKFNNNDITTLYIKQLLKDFNLLKCEVWKPGMLVYINCFYVKGHNIYRARKTGSPDKITTEYFKLVNDNYTIGDNVLNLTKNLVVNNLIYDSYTHEYLGSYLRFLRDYTGVNLMSLYNCYSNKTISSISISNAITGMNQGVVYTKNFDNKDGSKIYEVPIRPYNEYSIYLDSIEPVEFIVCYYDGHDVLDLKFGETKSSSFPYSNTYIKKSNLSFSKPFIYDRLSEYNMKEASWDVVKDPLAYQHRDEMRLLIKVSAANNSSLVVLEGNYKDNADLHFENGSLVLKELITSKPYDPNTSEPVLNKVFDQNEERKSISKLGLTKLQTNVHHPFSDRLIEYLIGNVINPNDEIEENIVRVQKLLLDGIKLNKDETVKLNRVNISGIWSNAIRNCLNSVAVKKNINNIKYDVLGYVDKDMENAIGLEDDE